MYRSPLTAAKKIRPTKDKKPQAPLIKKAAQVSHFIAVILFLGVKNSAQKGLEIATNPVKVTNAALARQSLKPIDVIDGAAMDSYTVSDEMSEDLGSGFSSDLIEYSEEPIFVNKE